MDKDNENCDCGHEDCNHEHMEETIILTLDDDTELTCSILGVFDVKEKSYIALMPITENNDEEILIYQYSEDEEGMDLQLIEDDDEFEMVSDAFDELFQFEDDYDIEYEEEDEDQEDENKE